MSLKTILEFSLHLEKFRNIDLYQQGLYCLKFKIIATSPNFEQTGRPIQATSKNLGPQQHNLHQAQNNSKDNSFQSKYFYIRYCDEQVQCTDSTRFQFELEASEDLDSIEFELQTELLFTDIGCSLDVETIRRFDFENLQLTSVQQVRQKLTTPQTTLHQFIPISFEEQYFSVAFLVVQACKLDYVLPQSLDTSDDSKSSSEEGRELAKALFNGKAAVDSVEILSVYNSYIMDLIKAYNRIKVAYAHYSRHCISLRVRESMHYDYTIQDLKLPGSSVQLPYGFKAASQKRKPSQVEDANIKFTEKLKKAEKITWDSRFPERIATHDSELVSIMILKEVHVISSQLYRLWENFMEVTNTGIRKVTAELKREYITAQTSLYKKCFLHRQYMQNNLVDCEEDIGTLHGTTANFIRQTSAGGGNPLQRVPIIFEEKYVDKSGLKKSTPGSHLIVLVHGYKGTSYDMRVVKNVLSTYYSETFFMSSSANEGQTEGDIREMGIRLANEVRTYIKENCPLLGKLSFIGHSLGGLIIRAAIPYLGQFESKFHLYFSMCTPHLGYQNMESGFIKAGMWIIRTLKRETCISQLSLKDSNPSLLQQISEQNELSQFQHVVIAYSHQDKYVPMNSARITVPDAQHDPFANRMGVNILEGIKNLYRLDVNFNITEKNMDTYIGRAAHIQFIENMTFLRMLALRYTTFFYQ